MTTILTSPATASPAAVWVTGPQPTAPEPAAAPTRPRSTTWPFAGLVAGIAGAAGSMMLAQGPDAFEEGFVASTDTLYAAMSSATVIKIGGGLAFISLIASVVFLVGLIRHIERQIPLGAQRISALRMSAAAFIGSSSIGVGIRYIAAGGAEDGIDKAFYSKEASTVISVLADQLSFAALLPGLLVMGIVGWTAFRDRVLPRTVGVIVLGLAAVSTAATLALGLPYSAGLVVPLFLLVTGGAGILTRTSV